MANKSNPAHLNLLPEKLIENRVSKKRETLEFELHIDSLGQVIKQIRQVRKLTQEQLSELTGVHKSQIAKIENNIKNVRLGTILKVLCALGASINFSITWD